MIKFQGARNFLRAPPQTPVLSPVPGHPVHVYWKRPGMETFSISANMGNHTSSVESILYRYCETIEGLYHTRNPTYKWPNLQLSLSEKKKKEKKLDSSTKTFDSNRWFALMEWTISTSCSTKEAIFETLWCSYNCAYG